MKRTTAEVKKNLKLILVGNGMTSFKFCEKFLKYKLNRKYDLTVFGEEGYAAYDRVNLTKYFEVESEQELCLAPISWYGENKITLTLGDPIIEINREGKWVKSKSGCVASYDKLIFATGSSAFVPPIEGINLDGVFVYRTINDLQAIRQRLAKAKKAVVIGGGILGLEAARALLNAGIHTTVIEMAPHLMPRQLDAHAAAILKEKLKALGLHVQVNSQTKAITGNGKIESISFSDGSAIDADLLVISVGISPRDELAKAAGLKVGTRGGIEVNDYTLTSDENIYAIGECALALGKMWGLATPCFEMADVLASRLAGIYKAFSGDVLFTRLKILEVQVAYFGDGLGEKGLHDQVVYTDQDAGIYKRINISKDGKYILGGILLGDTSDYATLLQQTRNKTRINGRPEDLIGKRKADNSCKMLNWPDSTIICLCEQVSKGAILEAIENEHLMRLDQVKAATDAGTGCEGCTSILEEMLTRVLRK